MPDRKLKLLMIARDDGGCGYHRISKTADFLKRSGLVDASWVLRTPTRDQILAADLVVMQELGSVNASNITDLCRKNQIPYMCEIDDFIHHVSPRNAGGYGAWNPSTLYVYRAMEMVRGGIGLTVSTPQLAREYFPYNPFIYVVPNYLDHDVWDNPIAKKNDGKIRIGWIGGNAHGDDLLMIAPVIEKIVKEYKGKVLFETIGMLRQELAGIFHLNDQINICPSCGYEGEVHHFPGYTQNEYPLALCSSGWDIAVAPVINNSFGNCKSDLKIKEYAAAGIPIIASPIVPYVEAAKLGARIDFAETFDEWYNKLKNLIEDSLKRDEIVKINKEWVSGRWMQDRTKEIAEVYLQALSRVDPSWMAKKKLL